MEELSEENFVFLSILSKIALHAGSILTILPKDDPRKLYGSENFRMIDISSIASLTRDIIDADNMLFYLFTERVQASEREFRLLLFGLHGYMRQKEIVNLIGGPYQEDMSVEIENRIDEFRNKLEANSFFKSLEGDVERKTQRGKRAKEIFKRSLEGRIENVKDAVFLKRQQIAEVREMNTSSFDAVYVFLSGYVHSFLTGTSLSAITLDDKSLLLLLLTLRNALFYMSLAMVDTVIRFQGTEEKLSPEAQEILQRIIRGESFVL